MRRTLYVISLLSFLLPTSLQSQMDYANATLSYGEHTIGFRRTMKVDSSRTYTRVLDYTDRLQFREVPISIWYPATEESQERMQVMDYLNLLKEEEEFEKLPPEFILDWFYVPRNPITERNSQYRTQAFADAPAAGGRYPVILYSPSYHASSSENFMLCEYLASHGYLVLAAPSRGAHDMRLRGGTVEDAGAQLRDLQLLFGYAAGLPQADVERVFTIGFSFGGLSNVLLTMGNRFVDGVISLDGTIKYTLPSASAHPVYDLARMKVPFVHFRQKDIPRVVREAEGIDQKMATRFEFMDSLSNTIAYEFVAPDLTHGQFGSYGILFEPRDERQDRPAPLVHAAYADLCLAVLHSLREMESYETTNLWNGDTYESRIAATGHVLARKSVDVVPKGETVNDFFHAVRRTDFNRIDSVYAAFRARNPSFHIPEHVLNTVGLQLGMTNDSTLPSSSIALYQFAIRQYPLSANLYDSIATVYQLHGDKEQAILHFRRSLALNQENENAVRQLQLLGAE